MHIRISLCIKLHFEQTILNFWTKFAQQRYLWSKTEKVNIIIEFGLFKLVFVAHFSLNRQFWSFGPDLPKKGFSGLKQKKWMPHVFYIILHIQISLVRNFSSSWQTIFVFWIKRYFQSKTEKVKIIIEFRISKLVSWYQIFALTEKFFLTRFLQERVVLVDTRKSEHHVWCLVGSTSPIKMVLSLWARPHLITSKSSPNLYALPGAIWQLS